MANPALLITPQTGSDDRGVFHTGQPNLKETEMFVFEYSPETIAQRLVENAQRHTEILSGRRVLERHDRIMVAISLADAGNVTQRTIIGTKADKAVRYSIEVRRQLLIDAAIRSPKRLSSCLEALETKRDMFSVSDDGFIDLAYMLRKCGLAHALQEMNDSVVWDLNVEINNGIADLTTAKSHGTLGDGFTAEARKLLEQFQFTDDHPGHRVLQLAASE